MNRLTILLTMLFLLAVGFTTMATAQSEKELLAQLASDNETAIEALVLYPEDTRLSIFEAARYPGALIKLESIQAQTSSSFRELLETYPQSTQEMIWDLTRYPDLVGRLAATGGNSDAQVRKVLKDYPDVVHERAKKAVNYYFDELAAIDDLNRSAEAAFSSLLDEYPPNTQAALNELIALPEVLTILTENIRFTVLIGDMYEKEPEWLVAQADSLSLVVARENAQELEDWKASLEDNPEAMEELQASAEEFADDYGYDDVYYEGYKGDDIYYDETDNSTIVHHYYYDYHYPYWFGYPYWYVYPRWRAYPYWYDWGFYFGPHRTVVVIGLPSFYYTNWYFYHPYHHYNYPHLSAHFVNHYYGHRSINSSVTVGVSEWKSRNREVINEEWLRNDGHLTSRFKEYGKFESERVKYNRAHPTKAKSQTEYIERYSSRYPSLAKASKATKIEKDAKVSPRPNIDSKTKPQTTPKEKIKTKPEARTRPKTAPSTKPKTQPRTQPEVRKEVPKVKIGTELHRNTWEKTKPKTQPRVQKPAPRTSAPKTMKPRTPKPKTKTGGTVRRKN